MEGTSIYRDIARRTGGDIYVGVVGPVRSGKSTFIQKFMENLVLPNISEEYDRSRATDEMPQSASGRTIMTTEPKFIPDESVKITVSGNAELNVRMIDCVGYIVDGAIGAEEDGTARMVRTPWSDEPVPFEKAAEMGTERVIKEHSTIGMLVTTDGSIGEIPRESYVPAEERVANELKSIGKPFAIILNSAHPELQQTQELALELEKKYGVSVALVNCMTLDAEDIMHILDLVLSEFPVRAMTFSLPDWITVLDKEDATRKRLRDTINTFASSVEKLGDIKTALSECDDVKLVEISAGEGTASLSIPVSKEEFYSAMSSATGLEIDSDRRLFCELKELSEIKREYSKVADALRDVNEKGYGIVMPKPEELEFDEPKIVKQSGGWGIKLAARANSIHMIRANIETELSPVVGSEQQSEEALNYLIAEFEEDPKKLRESNMFGKSIYDLISDGLHAKLSHMPDDARVRLSETLERIINEGSSGLICILL